MMQTARINSLCSRVTSGGTPSRKHRKYYADSNNGHLWVKSKELLDRAIDDTEERISDEGLQRSSAKYLPANTALMAMYGANVGQLGWLKCPATVNQAVCGMVVDGEIADPRYVFYALLYSRPALTAKAQGAAQQNLNQGLIKEFEIPTPPLKAQKQIAAILSAYDDLIENNLRRIKISEEMAQDLYREWFVKFRFPGHEQVRMVDSPLGKIPEGWEVMSVSEAVDLNPKLNIEKDKEKFFVPMSGLSTDSMVITEFKYRTGNNGAKFQNGDTLFARITPSTEHGKTGFVQCLTSDDEVAFGSTEYIVMRSKYLNPYAVYFLARELDLREHAIRSMTGASGRQRVQVGCFDNFFIATSAQDVLEKFEQAVAPNFRLIQKLWDKNRALSQTRDLLLPKLISGELDVSELDINIEETA
ncbi:MAG: restriction endonuclease subunit S [Rhodothermaceae bacterium]|nr:restriction endonuclease subunit S [Rhodothermaceae bacterium]MXZ58348.1 restriction endonuclease subunit S [Rhodothermaceae bacterium]MYB91141.1 restriction endonuclease subunit S [Rhodothermaceae bacterium]MYD67199.1 restriction endonuclease subunit S [Rhodothermaceae bacterium]MYG44576.1 restriction endonuclease subunit S [Rhodothermaceae bacterium]